MSSRILICPGDLAATATPTAMSGPLGGMPGVRPAADPGQVLFPLPAPARGPWPRCQATRYPGMVRVRVAVPAPGTPGLTRPASVSSGIPGSSPGAWSRRGPRTGQDPGSSWPRFPPVTLCAVARGQFHRHGGGTQATCPGTGCQRHSYLGDPVRGMSARSTGSCPTSSGRKCWGRSPWATARQMSSTNLFMS